MSHRPKNTHETQVKGVDWVVHETDFHGLNKGIDELLALFGDGSDGAIQQSKVDLLELAPSLPKICLLDFVFDDAGRLENAMVRFHGEAYRAFFGEQTHQSVKALKTSNATDRILDTSQRICELSRPVVCVSNGTVKAGGTFHADLLFVPLSGNEGHVTGALVYMDLQFSKD